MSHPPLDPPAPGTEATAAQGAELLGRLRPLCGKAFAGRIVADTPTNTDDTFQGRQLVMHVRDCTQPDIIRVPFHVGDDHSRTWVFQRLSGGARLKHDHRHRDGSSDAMTMYGGDLKLGEHSGRYEFPGDDYSKAMFRDLGREVSMANVWAIEIDDKRFVYELARPGRLFRVEFDLTRPVPAPPPPWGD